MPRRPDSVPCPSGLFGRAGTRSVLAMPTGVAGCGRERGWPGTAYERAREWRLACEGTSDPCSGSDDVPCSPLQSSAARVGARPGLRRFLVLRTHLEGSRLSEGEWLPPGDASPRGCGAGRASKCPPCPAPRAPPGVARDAGARSVLVLSDSEDPAGMWADGPPFAPKNERSTLRADDGRPPSWSPEPRGGGSSARNATWLILPVVICLSQRLSHACVSMN